MSEATRALRAPEPLEPDDPRAWGKAVPKAPKGRRETAHKAALLLRDAPRGSCELPLLPEKRLERGHEWMRLLSSSFSTSRSWARDEFNHELAPAPELDRRVRASARKRGEIVGRNDCVCDLWPLMTFSPMTTRHHISRKPVPRAFGGDHGVALDLGDDERAAPEQGARVCAVSHVGLSPFLPGPRRGRHSNRESLRLRGQSSVSHARPCGGITRSAAPGDSKIVPRIGLVE